MNKRNYQVINEVVKGSVAEHTGIEKGDVLKSINGRPVIDVIDYQYQMYDEYISLEVIKKATKKCKTLNINKEIDQDLGLKFCNELMDDTIQCRNKCIFCFVDQLPKGLRNTLYVKDDDWRLSFLLGNYITLTNMDSRQLDRILNMRISPLYISVHSTDPDLRSRILRNKNARNINSMLKKISDAGIQFNTQIVLCAGINDRKSLDKTIFDLAGFYPQLRSIAVVPVGLTKYRENLTELRAFTKSESEQTIEQVEEWQSRFRGEFGTSLVFLSDEFYIMAHKKVPGYEHYEDFIQLENGVGMLARFKRQFELAVKKYNSTFNNVDSDRKINIVTSEAAVDFIKHLIKDIESYLNINVISIKNEFFGDTVNVAGLITGRDLLNQLQKNNIHGNILIPETMLNDDGRFLDDLDIDYISESLNSNVTAIPVDGMKFLESIIGTGITDKE